LENAAEKPITKQYEKIKPDVEIRSSGRRPNFSTLSAAVWARMRFQTARPRLIAVMFRELVTPTDLRIGDR
jgi:hypothetical protein